VDAGAGGSAFDADGAPLGTSTDGGATRDVWLSFRPPLVRPRSGRDVHPDRLSAACRHPGARAHRATLPAAHIFIVITSFPLNLMSRLGARPLAEAVSFAPALK
jgi:hypothetical protein